MVIQVGHGPHRVSDRPASAVPRANASRPACRARALCRSQPPRLLVVPGLHDSDPAHWQTWLQNLHRDSVRVVQDDWLAPDLVRWSARIGDTLAGAGGGPWLVAAHSFGVLALAHHLARQATTPAGCADRSPDAQPMILGALMVAPAEPAKFGLEHELPTSALPGVNLLIGSQTDPWMRIDSAHLWARRWGAHFLNLGDAGHINSESGHGPLLPARRWLIAMTQRHHRQNAASVVEYEENE